MTVQAQPLRVASSLYVPTTGGTPELLRAVLDGLEEGVACVDAQGRIFYWNDSAERISGLPKSDVVGLHCAEWLSGCGGKCRCCAQSNDCPLAAAMRDGQERAMEARLHHRSGHEVAVRIRNTALRGPDGRIVGGMQTFTPKSATACDFPRLRELARLAYLDPLTGVANRRCLENTLRRRFAEKQRYGWGFGVILCDVDHLKEINDELGHLVGDGVLRGVSRILQDGVRSFDLVGRWGGDEFLLIAPGVDRAGLAAVTEKLRALVEQSQAQVDGKDVPVTLSAGTTVAAEGDESSSLLERADRLLYQSKHAGRNRVASDFGFFGGMAGPAAKVFAVRSRPTAEA